MDKEVRYIDAMEYDSATKGNEFESLLMRQMNLEPVTQSEVSQKEKSKYLIVSLIHGIQKDGRGGLICRAETKSHEQRTNVWTPREEVGAARIGDWDQHIHTAMYKIGN